MSEPLSDEELSEWREVAKQGSAFGECAGEDLRRLVSRLDHAERRLCWWEITFFQRFRTLPRVGSPMGGIPLVLAFENLDGELVEWTEPATECPDCLAGPGQLHSIDCHKAKS